jgi:DNA-binding response OmpR family regulator
MSKILIVEDDQALSANVAEWLKSKLYTVETVFNGRDALEHLRAFDYDAIVLDWELPEMTGVEILKQFRASGGTTPIIMLTGKGTVEDKEQGFDAGADDYLTKPFHPQELSARIRALLRRPAQYTGTSITVRHITLDTAKRKVTKEGVEVALQPMEYTLLEFLMKHPDQVFSTDALMRRCWESDAEISLDAIYTCIRRIRKKVDVDGQPSIIGTVHGIGYKLDS